MRYSVETISRDFTPAEAATVTGVSTTLQRDWRRRGVIESKADGTWTRWRLEDIIRLAVMKLLSDAGVDVSSTKIIAHMAILPTLVAMEEIDGAVVFEGDEIPDLSRERIRAAAANDAGPAAYGRFLVCGGSNELDVTRVPNLAAMDDLADEEPRAISFVIDCWFLASLIVDRAGGPVIRRKVEITAE
ncbi:MerR family transcriptional regulator [Sandaracinobacteroides hominis]|uniref:hypothetical protein n=1 Tax=Sandaracinobacteroides hominis TaxID=2780086 RepID=UPI0018F43F1E|nr:hypothetical protein [Sandaracinobacteroides hominis]